MSNSRVRGAALGAIAGTVGTIAMDTLLYMRARKAGTEDAFKAWEFADGVENWDQASAPGQVGRKVEALVVHGDPPDKWARPTTNIVHWITGAGWGAQYGVLAGTSRRRVLAFGLLLGPAAWLSSYVVLPLAKVYKPIWKYDKKVLADDLSAHMVYGAASTATFAALTRRARVG